MARLFLIVVFVAVIAFAALAVLGTLKATAGWVEDKEDAPMHEKVRRIAYIVLVILMFGVTTGWLGAS